MTSQHFLESLQLSILRMGRTADVKTADCLEAIAKCLRTLAETDPALGAIVWAAVKMCGEGKWLVLARILERIVTDIRLEASRKGREISL
jgi:hypothetical protein